MQNVLDINSMRLIQESRHAVTYQPLQRSFLEIYERVNLQMP